MVALRKPLPDMTVAEFLEWDSGDRSGALWQLRDGEPEMMAPASDPHGMIQSELGRLIGNHLADSGSPCRVGTAPGVVPRVRSSRNLLVPDLGVTCTPPAGGPTMQDPVVLIEILSPSNARETRANVWAYTSILSVAGDRSGPVHVDRGGGAAAAGRWVWPSEPQYVGRRRRAGSGGDRFPHSVARRLPHERHRDIEAPAAARTGSDRMSLLPRPHRPRRFGDRRVARHRPSHRAGTRRGRRRCRGELPRTGQGSARRCGLRACRRPARHRSRGRRIQQRSGGGMMQVIRHSSARWTCWSTTPASR